MQVFISFREPIGVAKCLDPIYYSQFAVLKRSEKNWYYVDNKLIKYINYEN